MRHGLRVLVSVVALLGCGCFSPVGEPDYWRFARARGDGGLDELRDGGGGGVIEPRGCPHVPCASFGAVETFGDLLAQTKTLSWTTVARPTSVCLPASNDFGVNRTLNLAASDLTPPKECAVPGSCAGTTFEVSSTAQGVTCLDGFCTTLMLTGARFRLRLVVHDEYPDTPRFIPVAEVLPSCQLPCAAGELRCSAHSTCWDDDLDFCRFCIAAPQEECACLGKLEGDACLIFQSNDLSCLGTCREDRCALNAGQPNCPAL